MADTALDICSRAMVMIGSTPITSFRAADTPSIVANQLYEPTVRYHLTRRWGFARTEVQLSRLTAAPLATEWEAEYQVPADLIAIHRVTVAGLPIRFERFHATIRCNASSAESVVMTYVRRVDEAEWPAYFTGALELELAARFAFPVTSQESLAAGFMRQARDAWAHARLAGSQEQSAQQLPISRMKAVRRGRG